LPEPAGTPPRLARAAILQPAVGHRTRIPQHAGPERTDIDGQRPTRWAGLDRRPLDAVHAPLVGERLVGPQSLQDADAVLQVRHALAGCRAPRRAVAGEVRAASAGAEGEDDPIATGDRIQATRAS
jgi:hypothetical protein